MTVHPAMVMWRFLMGPPDSDPANHTNHHHNRGYASGPPPKELEDMTNNPVHTKPLTVSADTANRLVANLERQQEAARLVLTGPFVRVTELTKLNHIRAVYTYYVASDGPNWVVRSNGNKIGEFATTADAKVAHDAIVMFSMADGFTTK